MEDLSFLTRECSCTEEGNTVPTLDTSYSYSSLCNGFTRLVRSCSTTTRSVETWKSATWPNEEDTKYRTFNCSTLTWFELINLSNLTHWEELAVEFIAAELNILSGHPAEPIQLYLNNAESLLNVCKWSKEQSGEAEDLISSLHTFNTQYSTNKLDSALADNNSNKPANTPSQTLLLIILLPSLVSAIAVIIAAVILIKKMHQKQDVSNA